MKQVITVSLPDALVWKLTGMSKTTGIPRSRFVEDCVLFAWCPFFNDMYENGTGPNRDDLQEYLKMLEGEYEEAKRG